MTDHRRHDSAVLEALEEGACLTRREMMAATGMRPKALDDALWRLVGARRIKSVPGGKYKAVDMLHSKAVKRGLFISNIPKLGE